MKADKYETLKNARYRKQQNEKNDCSVMATAIACRLSYKKSHELMASHGRRTRGSAHTHIILNAARSLGFTLTPVKNLKQKNGSKFTPKTIGAKLKAGYYLAFINGHVLGVVNGEVYDWTNNRNHHIIEAYKVTRTRA